MLSTCEQTCLYFDGLEPDDSGFDLDLAVTTLDISLLMATLHLLLSLANLFNSS